MGMKTFLVSLAVASAAFALSAGCNTVDEADNAVDCNDVCTHYKDCFDKSFDSDTCAKRCRDQSNEVKDVQRRVNACDVCLDSKSCAESSQCATDCAGLTPQFGGPGGGDGGTTDAGDGG